MTTYDTTISMLRELPEHDLQKVLVFVRDSFFRNDADAPFDIVSEESVMQRLENTRKKVEKGEGLLEDNSAVSIVREKFSLWGNG